MGQQVTTAGDVGPGGISAADRAHLLRYTEGLWDALRGQQLFVTGGTGFLGCWVLEAFTAANAQHGLGATAVVLTRDPDGFARHAPPLAADPAIRLHQGDVRSFAFPSGRFAYVIHGAGSPNARLNAEEPLLMVETLVQGTRHTLEFARQAGAKRVLLMSSGAIYGPQPVGVTHQPEEALQAPDTTRPRSAYAEGKRMAELLCAIYNERCGLSTIIARCFAFLGPYQQIDSQFATGNFIRDALTGGPIRVTGDGRTVRSYLYGADLAVWLWHLLLRGAPGRAYNVGSEHALTITELAHVVAGLCQPAPAVHQANAPTSSPPDVYVPSTHRARTELGLAQRIGLEDAIQRTCAWHRARRGSTDAVARTASVVEANR